MPAIILLCWLANAQAAPERAAERIRQAQECYALEARAQHREIEQAQPVSRLEPELAGAHRRMEVR